MIIEGFHQSQLTGVLVVLICLVFGTQVCQT